MKKTLAITALLLGAAAPEAAPVPVAGNAGLIARFAHNLLDRRDPTAAFADATVDMIQHNPTARDGRAAAIALTTPLFSQPGARFTPRQLLVDGDYVFVHYHGQLAPGAGASVAELFRVSSGRLAEHWDAFQPSREPAGPPTVSVEQGPQNRALIEDFARTLYTRQDARAAFTRDAAAGLVVHDEPEQGRDAAIAHLAPMISDPAEHYTVTQVLAAGEYGVVHVHAVNSRTHVDAAVFDIVRVTDGKISEIWPIVQVVAPGRVNPRSPV